MDTLINVQNITTEQYVVGIGAILALVYLYRTGRLQGFIDKIKGGGAVLQPMGITPTGYMTVPPQSFGDLDTMVREISTMESAIANAKSIRAQQIIDRWIGAKTELATLTAQPFTVPASPTTPQSVPLRPGA